jgi:hypothetical protein
MVSSESVVRCPDNQCSGYDDNGLYRQFVAGAGGASGYVGLSSLGQLNEWQGKFLNNSDFYKMEVALPAYQQQLKLEIAKVAAYLGISSDDAAKVIVTDTSLSNRMHPWIGGGNWNFAYDPGKLSEYTTLAMNGRVPGLLSLHLHTGDETSQYQPFSHVDTADPLAGSGFPWVSPLGLLLHGFVDVLLGNSVLATGIPRN